MIPVPAGEEVGPKLVRLLYFVGAGVLCTAGINKWKDLERKSMIKNHQELNGPSMENPSNVSFFQNWIAQQHEDLDELKNALSNNSDAADEELKVLGEKGIKHFEDYCERRALMVKHDAASFMSPVWCTSFENAFLWIGGCRPSLSIRLVYSICGSELDAQLTEFLQGERKGNLAEISAHQLDMINTLQSNTVKEEEKMSNKMASLQEEIVDDPLALIAKNSGEVGEWIEDLDRAMNAHSLSLAGILVEADRLQLNTLKDLMSILTPKQAVDLLVATKKLHLSIQECAKKRDRQFGKTLVFT